MVAVDARAATSAAPPPIPTAPRDFPCGATGRSRLTRFMGLAATALVLTTLAASCAAGAGGAAGSGGTGQVGGAAGTMATGGAGTPQTGAGGTTRSGGHDGATGGGSAIGAAGKTGTGGSIGSGGTPGDAGHGGAIGAAGTGGSSPGGTAGSTSGGGPGGGTAGYPLGNPAVPSAGCGKPLSAFKSGTNTYKMTSAGLDREYIVTLPDNYDQNAPHRLIFGMHWLGGSAADVQGWSKWFGLKALDTKSSTIFVAPQGYTDGSPWRSDDKDHVFFDDLLAFVSAGLCVDTSRVFVVGFSFGAMYTNALAQDHQDVLRGVVVYETADYNIYFPANTGKPLAYMGVHGIKDTTCPITAGRRSRDRFVKNNGCTIPSTIPEAQPGGNYVTYDYSCPSNHPVRWVTFDGQHTYPPNNTGTWVYGSTWEFISRF
jgi:poly(3-hydroxybutyrate) depolymerase